MFKMFYIVFLLSGGEIYAHPDRMTADECNDYGRGVSPEEYQCVPVKFYDAILKAKKDALARSL